MAILIETRLFYFYCINPEMRRTFADVVDADLLSLNAASEMSTLFALLGTDGVKWVISQIWHHTRRNTIRKFSAF